MSLDLHSHSLFSFDGHFTAKQMIESAIKCNLKVFALTEHCDFTPQGPEQYFLDHNTQRNQTMDILRAEYADKCLILKGIEFGQAHVNLKESDKIAKENDFDFIIGSVHNLADGRDAYTMDYTSEPQCKKVMELYLEETYKVATLSQFDSLGHIDFPMRQMKDVYKDPKFFTTEPYKEAIFEILKALVKREKALEVNTRGLICWQQLICPEDWVLKTFKQLGGKYLTIGSDSHLDEYVGLGIDIAKTAIKNANFDHVTYYINREPHLMEI